MIVGEAKVLGQESYGYWGTYKSQQYSGKAIIEFETVTKMRNFINKNINFVFYNGQTFRIIKRKKSRSRKFHCVVEAMTLRELNLQNLGI
jgi:hypothetical protein